MPTVIQSNVLPYQPTLRDKLLEAFISAAPQFLMTGLTGGFNLPKIPNPTYGQPSQINPGTSFSLGQAPSNTAPYPQVPQNIMGKISTPPGPYANQPMLNQQQMAGLMEAQAYKKKQQELDPNSPINQFLTAQASRMSAQASGNPSAAQPDQALVQYLAQRALAGDAEADAHLQALGY